jgi:tetratricopeptide (TPR) repeat protein
MATPDHPDPSASPLRRVVFDLILVIVALGFAFLAASYAVRNSDFWMHLASGRRLAEGSYQFGVDPFCYTTQDVYWANHAWLFDLVLFQLFRQFGGALLVGLKASLISILAALMLGMGRPDRRIALPALCTLLAVLAMSPRLLLHSTCLSYVFLGLTLWLLWRAQASLVTPRQVRRSYLLLLGLFVLWVNVDGWFLLGPLTATLFWLGERLRPVREDGDPRRTPGWLCLAGLVVCLINPHTWHAFTLPMDLAPLPAELRHDVRFERLAASPWHTSFVYSPAAGLSLSGCAFFALLALGLLSFLLNGRKVAGWRLLIWLSFAGLAAWLARAIPFFAVVAGPITALNLQDLLRDPDAVSGKRRRYLLGSARFALLGSGLALLALTWMGWLRGFQGAGRGVDWSVQPDGSLRRVAETLHLWHEQHKLHDEDRGFPFHPSIVHYCAWFCPEERGFLDHRFTLFSAVAGEYETVCRSLNPALAPERGKSPADWRAILRRHGITHLVLYDPDLPRLTPALRRLAVDERGETLLHLDGQALIVGWEDEGRRLPAGLPAFDAERIAFAPSGGEDVRMLPPAPRHGAPHGPRVADFWSHFGSPVPPPSWETDAAGVLIHYFEDRAPRQIQERITRSFGWAAALPGRPALSGGALDVPLRLGVYLDRMPPALDDLTQRSPAVPLLTVRAARRALADNPDDGTAYLYLGRAYLALAGLTAERRVLGSFQPLGRLRHIQVAVALENALRRNPDLEPAHEDLADLYGGRNFLDAALEHRREAVRLTRRAGPVGGESVEAFTRRLTQMETGTNELEREVSDRRNRFTLQAQAMGSQPYRKAQLALRMGLARLALEDVLMQSPMVLLGGEGVALQLELQLMLGRVEPVREQLHDPDWQANKKNLGYLDLNGGDGSLAAPAYRLPAYDWLLLCQAAAVGDYEGADGAIQALREGVGGQKVEDDLRRLHRDLPRAVALELGLEASRPSWLPRDLTRENRLLLFDVLRALSFVVTEQADLHVLAGMLSLERGLPHSAQESFAKARELSRWSSGAGPSSTGPILARDYLRLMQAARR